MKVTTTLPETLMDFFCEYLVLDVFVEDPGHGGIGERVSLYIWQLLILIEQTGNATLYVVGNLFVFES